MASRVGSVLAGRPDIGVVAESLQPDTQAGERGRDGGKGSRERERRKLTGNGMYF